MASWSPRRGGTAVAWLILISRSSAWVSYSTSTTCRDGLTTLLFDPCGRGSAHDCENVGIVPATTAHCSTTEADGLVVRRRRMMIALLPSIAMASFVPSTAGAKCQPSEALLDARMQLDLAVQASQAWDDAAEIANDPLLDEDNLLRALGSCQNQNTSRDRVTATVLESVRKMRDIVAKQGKTTEDAMTFMKYGTSARTAVDSYLE